MTQIKICGMTNREDALLAASCGVDALGFIFYEKTPRFIAPEQARAIIAALPDTVVKIGVFVNQSYEEIEGVRTFCSLDMIQLHGEETPEFCGRFPASTVIKAFSFRAEEDLAVLDGYPPLPILVDAGTPDLRGGTGNKANWNLARLVTKTHPLILAGGLSRDNICEALAAVAPAAVDINSGVESAPGRKDHEKMRKIIALIRQSDQLMEKTAKVFRRSDGGNSAARC